MHNFSAYVYNFSGQIVFHRHRMGNAGNGFPLPEETVERSAPVATNRTLFSLPAAISCRMYEPNTTALQPAPLPP